MSEENKQPLDEETPETQAGPQQEAPQTEETTEETAENTAKTKKKKEKGITFTREQV